MIFSIGALIVCVIVFVVSIIGWFNTQLPVFRISGRFSVVGVLAFAVIIGLSNVPIVKTPPPPKPKPVAVVPPKPKPKPLPLITHVVRVPSNHVGYLLFNDVIDCKHLYYPGYYRIKTSEKILLVDTSDTELNYNTEEWEISAMSKDLRSTNIQVVIHWRVVPETVTAWKCTVGGYYTPHVGDIVRPAIREVISQTQWKTNGMRDREALRTKMREHIQIYANRYFKSLGMGDLSDKVILIGEVNIVEITYDTTRETP